MIKPVMNSRITNPSFTSYYDRTCPHITSDIKFSQSKIEKILDVVMPKKGANIEAKEFLLDEVVNKVTNNLGADSHVALMNSTDMLNTDTGVMSHMLPDGSPVEIDAADLDVDTTSKVVGKVVEKIADVIDFFA